MEVAPVSPRRAQTRQRLITAARAVFAERGIPAASVEEICETAGFTRGAFYSNFDSKDDICLSIFREMSECYLASTEKAVASLADVAEASLETMVETAVTSFLAVQPTDRQDILLRHEMELYAARRPEIGQAYRALDQEMAQLFAAMIERSAAALQVDLVMPSEQVTEMLQAVYSLTSFNALLSPTDTTEAMSRNLQGFLLAMLRQRKDSPVVGGTTTVAAVPRQAASGPQLTGSGPQLAGSVG